MWDAATHTWSTGNLSSARMRVQGASLTAKNGTEFALIVGGLGSFSQASGEPYATGGLCTTVDVYNGDTGEWTWTNLTRGRYEFAVASVGDAMVVAGGKQGGVGPQLWNTVEVFNVTTMAWTWYQQPFGWSYNAGTRLPNTGTALFAGGDFQNGTTTDYTVAIEAASVVVPPHPPTYFPDLLGPPHLLVASLLPDNSIKWASTKAAKDAELVFLGSVSGSGMRHGASLGIFIEAVPDHRKTLAMLRSNAVAFLTSAVRTLPLPKQRQFVTTEYGGALDRPIDLARRVLAVLPEASRQGYVLYDLGGNPASLNYAKMKAFQLDALLLDTTIAALYGQALGIKQVFDASRMTINDTLVLASSWPMRSLAVEQAPGPTMVDYSVATGAISFYNTNTENYNNTIRNAFLALLAPNSASLGWGCNWTDETGCVSVAASHGVITEPSQSDYSLLTYGGYHHHSHFPFVQGAALAAARKAAVPNPPPPPKVHTVVFVTSDGDNVHWLHDGWLSQVWEDPDRGTFPVAMGLSPAERDLGQPLLEYLYHNQSANDSFVAMCTGGYAMMEHFPVDMRAKNAKYLAGYMGSLGMSTFVGFADDASAALWRPYMEHDEIDAAFHWTKTDGHCYSGAAMYPNVRWVKTSAGVAKPVVVGRMSLWSLGSTGMGKYPQCGDAAAVASMLNKQARDGADAQTGFSMIPVRVHGTQHAGLADVKATMALLEPGVEVVDAFEFVRRLKLIAPRKGVKEPFVP